MSLFLKPEVLAAAVTNIEESASISRILDFLILKRTVVLENNATVTLVESNKSHYQAIQELAAVGLYGGTAAGSDFKYINVFSTVSNKRGYRSSKFPSNGPNSTIPGPVWKEIIEVNDTVNPRTVKLVNDYVSRIGKFLPSKHGRPSLLAFAFWYYRHTDLEPLLGTSIKSPDAFSKVLCDDIIERFAFSTDELTTLFDGSDKFINQVIKKNETDIFGEVKADASEYLQPPVGKIKISTKGATTPSIEVHSRIVYGAPGTGKSWIVDEAAKDEFDYHIRVTFYPDYSFFQFVGGYKPKSLYVEFGGRAYHDTNELASPGLYTRRPVIDYVVVPGPFMSTLVRAYQHPKEKHLLIVEELNRANAAAVFGDLFQLLDRNDEGVSTYAATVSIEMSNWLLTQKLVPDGELIEQTDSGELKLRLPKNFFIWATMNSADQGVQPLDAAFKRRWSFQYVPLNSGEAAVEDWTVILAGRVVLWNKLRRILNKFLVQQGSNGRSLVAEDRLLGPFFMKPSELSDSQVVLNKLMLYMRDDLVRHNPAVIFASGALNFSDLYDTYTQISDAVTPETDSAKAFTDDLHKLFSPLLASELGALFTAAEPETVAAEDE